MKQQKISIGRVLVLLILVLSVLGGLIFSVIQQGKDSFIMKGLEWIYKDLRLGEEFFFLPFMLLMGGLFWYGRNQRKKMREAWKSFALTHGLDYRPPPSVRELFSLEKSADNQVGLQGHVKGKIDGRQVSLHSRTTGTGKNRNTHYELWVEIKGAPEGLSISRENVALKFFKWVAGNDIQVGNAEFDQKYLIRGENDVAVRGWLNFERQRTIDKIVTPDSHIEVLYQGLCVKFGYTPRDKGKLDQTLRELLQKVVTLDN